MVIRLRAALAAAIPLSSLFKRRLRPITVGPDRDAAKSKKLRSVLPFPPRQDQCVRRTVGKVRGRILGCGHIVLHRVVLIGSKSRSIPAVSTCCPLRTNSNEEQHPLCRPPYPDLRANTRQSIQVRQARPRAPAQLIEILWKGKELEAVIRYALSAKRAPPGNTHEIPTGAGSLMDAGVPEAMLKLTAAFRTTGEAFAWASQRRAAASDAIMAMSKALSEFESLWPGL